MLCARARQLAESLGSDSLGLGLRARARGLVKAKRATGGAARARGLREPLVGLGLGLGG